ncbi:MAG: SDR family oxidoreductase, partial [Phycisphaerae bacterium]|nr:SDR family oxidoreductase [Phycisphaerae bacterium]
MPAEPHRTILITGVTRGLGRALAEILAREGHTILGCGRSRTSIEDLARSQPPPNDFDCVDIADEQQVTRWARRLLGSHPPPDILLNNAALINANAPLWQVPADVFSHLVDVNIKGVTHVIRHFLPAMIERGSGVVVNFSSTWGRSTSPQVAPYCASKWAIEGLTGALAQELPPGLAAVALNPGVIDTDMLRTCFGSSAAAYPSPQDWARRAAPFILGFGPSDNGTSP